MKKLEFIELSTEIALLYKIIIIYTKKGFGFGCALYSTDFRACKDNNNI